MTYAVSTSTKSDILSRFVEHSKLIFVDKNKPQIFFRFVTSVFRRLLNFVGLETRGKCGHILKMKFKTLFQRRSNNSSVADSDPLSTTTKRKKKETKSLTTIKSAAAGTTTTTTNTRMTVPVAAKEKCAPCPEAAAEVLPNVAFHHRQPQPDDNFDCLLFRCENCGGRENFKTSGTDITEVENMKLDSPSNGEGSGETMDSEDYKVLFQKAQCRIKELSEELKKVTEDNEKKDKDMKEMHHDFLLCIRGAERFRQEAEARSSKLQCKVVKLEQEIMELKQSKRIEDVGATKNSAHNNAKHLEAALVTDEIIPGSPPTYREATTEVKTPISDGSAILLGEKDTKKVEDVLNKSLNERRREKLYILRKKFGGSVRNGVLNWCKEVTQGYQGLELTNFSSSWTDGLAFAALIHSLVPGEYDYNELSSSCPVANYEVALKAAEKLGIHAELDVLKIISCENPPWEQLFTYATEVYLAVTQ